MKKKKLKALLRERDDTIALCRGSLSAAHLKIQRMVQAIPSKNYQVRLGDTVVPLMIPVASLLNVTKAETITEAVLEEIETGRAVYSHKIGQPVCLIAGDELHYTFDIKYADEQPNL